MIIVLTILVILATIVGCVALNNDWEWTGGIALVGAILIGILDLIAIVWCIKCGAEMYVIDGKIEMYQQENTKIEEQMTSIIQDYKGYEERTIKNIADMEKMVLRFPELKTSELVSKQMDIYVKNNDEIKKLKKDKIDSKIGKWLLYFGR